MYRLVPITSALVLALAAPTAVFADPGNGKGGDKQERGQRGGEARDSGAAHAGGHGAQDNPSAGRGNGRPDRPPESARNGPGRTAERGPDRAEAVRVPDLVRGDRGDGRRDANSDVRREVARQVFQTRDGRPVVYFSRDEDRGLIAGCPPGLAKKNNGCLPPGQARQIARAAGADRYDWLWRMGGGDGRYEYRGGYLYRVDPQGSPLGWLPVLGGALSPGAVWPAQYRYQPAPDYYSSYFGLPANRDYRYANGALYGVDPQTQMISQVAALLTGENIGVGQRLPAGYDVYNVPYDYRSRYVDGPDAMYRYNDGYVYQADPKTQLVTAVIQLLT
ncbi:hypothetical protein BrevBR_12100 [Brevundimonas sp. BR2-1]|uniref:hypothetical protein n=1 Tax=Brevundimonas sp. BR2-1 TaxID=3031123 RepID=UPI0030A69343